ncbi:Mus7/MMS22 family-domain-containing protein [Ampelomyces quisqualis]|uniref:Mus7/MMS22 family-domain-containing protein n=1 Tax=Ampelomyces quisqualis TaxID=50730 RepID=A0A6A5QMY0_AMPQU|nr:Mus7/MMS22 family-domain-containing protein [Ampelomyces quisqualis]
MASHGISRGSGPVVRSEEARQQELQQITQYKHLVELVNTKIVEKQYTVEVLGHITKLLNENPEYYTIWNHRRRVLNELIPSEAPEKYTVDLIEGDLHLTFALLRKFPKCYWIWNHRNWLLSRAESVLGVEAARKLWSGELQLINKMLHTDSRNFHAWGYRRFVVSQIDRLATSTENQPQSLAESEFEYTTKSIKTNLSNFSAWHNRGQLIPQILNERNADSSARRAFLRAELSLISEAINTDPFDQSIWFYHQYLLSTISLSCPPHQLVVQDLTNNERQKYYEHEIGYINEIAEDETDCKWIYEALLGLAEACLEIDAGTATISPSDMRNWLNELRRLDPLRRGRSQRLLKHQQRLRAQQPTEKLSAHFRCRIALVAAARVDASAEATHSIISLAPPPSLCTPKCRQGQMSEWRHKGFVQDSDEEEEESQLESQNSRRHVAAEGRVERVDATEKTAHDQGNNESRGEREEADGRKESRIAVESGQVAKELGISSSTARPESPRHLTASPLTPVATRHSSREPTESPDPLQFSPKLRDYKIHRPISSQPIGSPRLADSSQVPALHLNYDTATSTQAPNHPLPPKNAPISSNAKASPDILEAFGIHPLSDASEDEDLSDPPTDLESPDMAYPMAQPHRRTAVQVVIPSSTALQRHILEQDSGREFRQRKPIQLHPYALEGEIYRREVQSRGLKPVPRPRSPERRPAQQEAESQEKDFDPNETPDSSPPELEIPVSTPVARKPRDEEPRGDSTMRHGSDSARPRLPATQEHLPRPPKRRRLNFSLTQATAGPMSIFEIEAASRDIWSIPPISPPHSSSPHLKGPQSAHRLGKASVATIVPDLLTPSTSSIIQENPHLSPDPDLDQAPRSATQSRTGLRRSARVILSDQSSSMSNSSSEAEQTDHEIRKVGKKIKGVLPASWLRFDQQAQQRRKAQAATQRRERAGRVTSSSPEPSEPQRGVAHRIMKRGGGGNQAVNIDTTVRNVVVISDGSEEEYDHNHRALNHVLQTSAEDATTLAATFDRRYAAEDSDDMENDRLHLFTLAGAGKKKKKQAKLTDSFPTARRPKNSSGAAKTSHLGSSGRKRHGRARKVHKTHPPAMSVVDLDLGGSSKQHEDIPQFLRLAKRQALRRPDLARQSPRTKQIRLHNARDTEEANITLQQWQDGVLQPRKDVASRQLRTERSPLTTKADNQQFHLQGQADDAAYEGRDTILGAKPSSSRDRRPRQRLSALELFRQVPRTKTSQHTRRAPRLNQILQRSIERGPQPFRTGQLEGDESIFGGGHRKIAFEKGLRGADHQALAPTRNFAFMNPQLARYLADDSVALPPLPSANETGEKHVEDATVVPPKKRLLRKKMQVQRIDIEAREYRQPSEPAVQEIVNQNDNIPRETETPGLQETVLQGLGSYGHRYPTTFDVTSLQADTYFHASTLVGSEDFRQALSVAQLGSRDLDAPAGYCIVTHKSTSVRCGPWNDETSSALRDVAKDITTSLSADLAHSNEGLASIQGEALAALVRFLRSIVNYVSYQLSFSDPVDRNAFAVGLHQMLFLLFDQVSALCAASDHPGPPDNTRHGLRVMTTLLVLATQTYLVARDTLVGTSVISEVQGLAVTIARAIIVYTLRMGTSELGNFLEQNRRHAARMNGIQDDDLFVESVVVSMHSLEKLPSPVSSFWRIVSQELSSATQSVTHISAFESAWATLFTLVPFTEIDISGIPTRDRREQFSLDDWGCVSVMVRRLLELYPSTYKKHGSSLNDYVRANLARCHRLIKYWHWRRPEQMLNVVFDFFGRNGLKQLQRESSGSIDFFNYAAAETTLHPESNECSFHIALRCLAMGLHGMAKTYTEKKIRSFVFRKIPNHGRTYPKDQPLDGESLAALRNHHDLLCTLYWAAPPPCRPKLELIRGLVSHETSHREACRVNVRTWANLATFQLSSDEPYESAKSFALWHKDIMHQTLKQYRLARTEADDYLTSGVLDGTTDVSVVMVRQAMERNQEQVIATLRDCIAGMTKAMRSTTDQIVSGAFLVDSDILHLLELPHLEDRRLVNVITDTLVLLQEHARSQKKPPIHGESQQTSEESQDYGDFPDMDDFDMLEPQPGDIAPQHAGLELIQTSLWHLLSNAFGAEISPDDNLLMDCIDTWILVIDVQVSSGTRSWSHYLDSFSQVSWQQLRQTEQTRKFGPYFLACLMERDRTAYEQHHQEFNTALLLSLVDRESMLRFQFRLLHSMLQTTDNNPLMKNLPFFRDPVSGAWDVTSDTVRTRRLNLLSSIFSNMRDDLHTTASNDPARTSEVRRTYATLLHDMMTRMRSNYLQLRQGTTITGAYVEFVQKVVQFLKQYTGDICPVIPFFTDSVTFPLPSADPTYVVGRLCGYAPKVREPGTAKQLSVFIQTVAQQAAAENQQSYLVNQLTAALCLDEAPAIDRASLRVILLQGVFPIYLELAFASSIASLIASPILQSLPSVIDALIFELRVTDAESISSILTSIYAVSHAFIRGTEQLKNTRNLFEQPYILATLTHMFEAITSTLPILEYVHSRKTTKHQARPPLVLYMEDFYQFAAAIFDKSEPDTYPDYEGNSHATALGGQYEPLLTFGKKGIEDSMKTNWSESGGTIRFGQGHAKREVIFDIGSVEEEREKLLATMNSFQESLQYIFGEEEFGRTENGICCDVVV